MLQPRTCALGTIQQRAGAFLASGISQLGAGGSGTSQLGAGAFSAPGTLQPGTGGSGTSQQGAGAFSAPGTLQMEAGALQQRAGAFSAPGTLQLGSGGQQVLQNPLEVCYEFSNLNENNVGKLARALACRSILGTETLKELAVTGDPKRGLKMLDKKLTELCSMVHQHHSFLPPLTHRIQDPYKEKDRTIIVALV